MYIYYTSIYACAARCYRRYRLRIILNNIYEYIYMYCVEKIMELGTHVPYRLLYENTHTTRRGPSRRRGPGASRRPVQSINRE